MHNTSTLLASIATTLAISISVATVSTAAKAQDKPTKSSPTGALSEKEFAALHELKQGAAPKLYGKDIEIGGTKAYLSLPASGKPTAAVLVIHEWWGLNNNVKHWADRIAADGHAALAIDLYGGVVATTPEEAGRAMRAVDKEKAAATLQSAYDFLAKDPRVKAEKRACIGWCFGGGWSLQLALAAPDLSAAVIYYGHLVDDPEQLARIGAPVLGVFGDKDRGIPPAAVDKFAAAMQKAGRELQLHRYDAEHAFANPSSARYDAKNAEAAWTHVRKFLRDKLAPTRSFKVGTRKVIHATPKGWTPVDAGRMRVATFDIGKSTECYVAVLAGAAGGVAANINRWRSQLEQSTLTADDLGKLPRIKILDTDSVLVRIDGKLPSGLEGTMFGAICTLKDQTLFVKMTGPVGEMKDQEAAFKAFCASLR